MRAFLGIVLAVSVAWPAAGATFDDPDWPCIQRKVPHLSAGQMWAGPPPIDTGRLRSWRDDAGAVELAPVLALRRTTIEDAKARIADYAAGIDGAERTERLATLFAGVFALIDRERSEIIAGIARYAHKQENLAERIEARRAELETLEAASDPDFDRIEEARDYLDWDVRVFRDRAQSLTYVCESPVILERRAFAIARAIQDHLN